MPNHQTEGDVGKDVRGNGEPSRGSRNSSSAGSAETNLQHVKCFNCHKKGHVKANCPEPRRNNTTVEPLLSGPRLSGHLSYPDNKAVKLKKRKRSVVTLTRTLKLKIIAELEKDSSQRLVLEQSGEINDN